MPEEEAFCVFVKLMQDYRLRELFKPSMAELGLCMYQFEYMIQVSTESILCPLQIPYKDTSVFGANVQKLLRARFSSVRGGAAGCWSRNGQIDYNLSL